MLTEQFSYYLQDLREKGLYRELKYLDAPQKPCTVINGKDVLLLASNSYLGLCDDKRLEHAAINAIKYYGVGAGGSRLTTGSYRVHKELEERIAQFKGTESSFVFNTGYMANLGTISGLADKSWTIFSDQLNHASIIDGCRLSGAKIVIYKHCDMDDLWDKVKRHQGENGLIVTDGVFSMDGDIAPLPDIVKIAKEFGLFTMVDDAHATGVLGPNGAGVADYFSIKSGIDIQMGTLSKALASEGGYVAGKKVLVDYLRHRARTFVYSTALAPATIAVALRALQIVQEEPGLRRILMENAQWLQNKLNSLGFNVLESKTPIIPVIIDNANEAVQFSQRLFEEGIFIPAIRPPTVPIGTSRLRITIMATHTKEKLHYVVSTMKKIGQALGVI
jgi:8-amino-7-oxononanoate synthase